jgi:penicillin-binding protein 1A
MPIESKLDDSSVHSDASEPGPDGRGCGGLFFLLTLGLAAFWGAGLGVFIYILQDAEKSIEALDEFRPKAGSRVYSADGEKLGEFARETRQIVSLNEIPLHVQKAFIATEDHTFYEHRGVRPFAYVSVLKDFLRTNHLRGASTITQQMVRNIESTGVSKDVTPQRKLREMLVALQLERRFTKDEILEMYLNEIFLGVSANGVQSAAQQYFLKNASDLTLGEAALLAGLTRSPNNNQPFRHADNARKRRDIVLAQMLEHGFITAEERDAALAESVDEQVITPEERAAMPPDRQAAWAPNKFLAPYFCEEVRQFISKPPAPVELDVTQNDLFEDGLEVYTTIDLRIQKAAEEVLLAALEDFDKRKKERLEKQGKGNEFIPINGALICLDNRPGYEGFVRAMVGGRDFSTNKFNLATQALRQPGSGVKPFVWLAALDNGLTPSSIVVDEPFSMVDGGGNLWTPANFDEEFQGAIPIRKALELSVNIVSIKLVERLGMPLVRSYLREAGFRQPIGDDAGLTLGLGTKETIVLDQATCYQTLALGGVRVSPVLITQIKDRDGIVRHDYRDFQTKKRVFDEDVTYQLTHLLQGVCEPMRDGSYAPTGRRTERLGRPRAGKTGTTNDARTIWFNGYTPQFTTIIMIGYDKNYSIGSGVDTTGGAMASPIWTDFMIRAHEGLPVLDFKVPAGVEFYNINRGSGLLGGNYKEAYIRGSRPPTSIPIFSSPEAPVSAVPATFTPLEPR